jgi:hypothetical protein
MVVGFITTYAIILFATVPITTKVVSSNPTQAGCTQRQSKILTNRKKNFQFVLG